MSEPRWLSDSEQWAWRAYTSATKLVNERLDRQLQRDSGMPTTYYEILVALSESPDRELRMSELAEFTKSSRSRLSHAIARLEENGWVTRRSCATDKRGAFAVLTEDGMAAVKAAAPGHVNEVRSVLFEGLTPEQVHQLGLISEAITTQASKGCPTNPCDE
ncbi:MarR family winged helix-turn-helix transcriptional regulator [Kutzneria kofuensis]|uniref:DNA-binding MarR family transcriptional regulator n=1 Tax=Kutzneria kofuensis TaxID=103725 RepID=A0A7W9KBT3_9PSEU|nr:MarR family transcriptional regulator [Kutzneria kofuensis]MBB5889725.1 DNA-binding MarR family transcriptional regulator [Kutzneria kofuensis]